jgi:hypothetical protein
MRKVYTDTIINKKVQENQQRSASANTEVSCCFLAVLHKKGGLFLCWQNNC